MRRSKLVTWLQAIGLALPAVALFFACRWLDGWLATTALILLVAYVALGIVLGVRAEIETRRAIEDDLDR